MNDVDFAKTSGGRQVGRALIGCKLVASRDAISPFLCYSVQPSSFELLSRMSIWLFTSEGATSDRRQRLQATTID